MLFDAGAAENAAQSAREAPGASFLFDWDNHTHVMEAGTPAIVTGLEAIKAWLQLVIRTRRGRYGVYPADFGTGALELIGQKLPRGYGLTELRRELTESAAYLPQIREIGPVSYDGAVIRCTVTLDLDGNEETEVLEVEP